MHRAVRTWLSQDRNEDNEHLSTPLARRLNKSYTVYGTMLLLPGTALEGAEWMALSPSLSPSDLAQLYVRIAHEMKVTHIAINRPIPLNNPESHIDAPAQENILRAPINFTPVHGDFGPATLKSSTTPTPTQHDFDAAFWTTARQNGIFQTWAPRWTMFSRGNISEKARLLTLPAVQAAVQTGRHTGRGCAAVDLYVGIGYFAFSYVRAGVVKVLGWDLNAWSLEGLRRGAGRNGWDVEIVGEDDGVERQGKEKAEYECNDESLAVKPPDPHPLTSDTVSRLATTSAPLLIFHETNLYAPSRIAQLQPHLPPIRHINCGMLPSSRASLTLAASIAAVDFTDHDNNSHVVPPSSLDADTEHIKELFLNRGAWIHMHENFLVEEIAIRAEQTRCEMEHVLQLRWGLRARARLEEIVRLKNYAPGVMHCVLDMHVFLTEGREAR